MATFPKDPDAVLDYGFDLIDWLEADEDLHASIWTIDPNGIGGLTIVSHGKNAKSTVIWLSGGERSLEYGATNHFETTKGRKDNRTIRIKVLER